MRELLPKLFGKEWNKWMHKPQRCFKYLQEDRLSIYPPEFSTTDTEFGDLEIPVTKFMPEKLIDRVGGIVKTILFQCTACGGDGALQAAEYPAIRQVERRPLHVLDVLTCQGKI